MKIGADHDRRLGETLRDHAQSISNLGVDEGKHEELH
jgi:hypothetical protein